MKMGTHSSKQHCLMCGCTGETDEVQLIWHQMVQGHLCENCDMELGIEFYEEESRYFDMASKATGFDVWECKKRYLQEMVSRIHKLLAGNSTDVDVLHKKWNLEQCQNQVQCIFEYQAACEADEVCEAQAYSQLKKAMQTKAFGLDLVIPGLVTITVE